MICASCNALIVWSVLRVTGCSTAQINKMMFHNGHRSFQKGHSPVSFCHLICAPCKPLIMWSLPVSYVRSTEHINMVSKGAQITFWCHSTSFRLPSQPLVLAMLHGYLKTTWIPCASHQFYISKLNAQTSDHKPQTWSSKNSNRKTIGSSKPWRVGVGGMSRRRWNNRNS